ncbi:MAG TPA: hypothetical protein VNX01_01605, partial [Bacteroidia bacterium]|nr:hypothetical protein [Bacteroidia bacterium]
MIKLKKTKAYLLLLVLVFDMFIPYMAKASTSKGGGGDAPVAASANNFVDLFTGNFKYSVPLMVVPGPNGEAVDISANCTGGGGVLMNQAASWIGLGWDLSPGEISREVIFTHDDNDGQQTVYMQYNTPSITGLPNQANEVYNTGTLATSNNRPSYLANFGYLYSGSGVQSTGVPEFFGGSDNQFKTAGFDNYYVSGPGISGKMSPHSIWNISTQASVNTQFLMENSTNLNVADASSTDFNVSTARFNSGYYIKYYKTTDIAGDKYSSSNKNGFIEYAGQGFSRSTFGAGDFAGFKITTPAGISYHYSLPVYCNEEYKYTFDCDFTTSSPSLSGNVSLAKKVVPYVTSWKLTAITGPDYVDSDNSATVSDGDQGYWVSYNYSLWCNNYLWASDYYNATTNMIYSGLKDVNEYLYGSGAPLVTYQNIRNNILKQHNQVYYLNSIKTATHTAFFIKDLRLDEISYDKIQNLGSGNPVPLQKLNKIILLRNEDAWLLNNSGAPTSNSNFDVSNCNPNGDNLHIGKYNANSTQIDLKSLKTIEFNTDYSLCPSYHKNINCSFTSSNLRVSNGNSNAYNQFKTVNNNSDLICTYSNPA